MFGEAEMDLINRATYKTATRIMLKSKRKYLREDPEAWFISNVVAIEHYKNIKTPMPTLIGEFERAYKGDDAPDRVRYLLDLGKRLYVAFYGTPIISDADLDAPSGDSWCHTCDKYNYSFMPEKWCEHRIVEPSERVEYITWCERCKQWHRKIIPVGGSINLEAVCPLFGMFIAPKEILTFDDDMGVVDEKGSIQPGEGNRPATDGISDVGTTIRSNDENSILQSPTEGKEAKTEEIGDIDV